MVRRVRGKFTGFEGLRGVLALTVCVGHIGLNTVFARIGATVHFGLAVDVFFALSGFVLSYSGYFGRKSWPEFLRGRVARLYPLHALTALFVLATQLASGHLMPGAAALLEQATLTHSLGLPPRVHSLNAPSWSISVELWVAFAFFALLRRRMVVPWMLLVLACIPLAGPGRGDLQSVWFTSAGVVRGLAGISVGVLAFQAYEVEHRLRCKAWHATLTTLLLLGLFLINPGPWALSAAFYLLTFLSLIGLADAGETVFSLSLPVWLGKLSYSIYLWHMPLCYAAIALFGEAAASGLVAKSLLLAAVMATATASHRWIELPCQRWLLALTARSRAVGARELPVTTASD
jgi:peptidoglycan/LPS O-acetylase OafA/YrhL